MAVAAFVISTVAGLAQNKKAAKQERTRDKIAGARAAAENARQRRASVAESRRLRAQTIAQGEAQGISGSSAVSGATGSILTQAASNISFAKQGEQAYGDINKLGRRANAYRERGAVYSSFAQQFAGG